MTTSSSYVLSAPARVEQDFALGRHLEQCRKAQGQWFSASMWAERVHQVVATRFVTSVGIVAAMMTLGSWWI